MLVVLIALGTCAVATAAIVPSLLGGASVWLVFVVGLVALGLALACLWVIQKQRDRTLR